MSKSNRIKLHWLLAIVMLVGTIAIPFSKGVYAAAPASNGIHEIPAEGTFGFSSDGMFNYPSGIAVDADGYVYVSDSGNHRIQKFGSDDNFVEAWGRIGDGNGEFTNPEGIAVDTNGKIYVVDSGNCRIQVFDAAHAYLDQWGNCGEGNGQFSLPKAVAIDDLGFVYVVDSNNNRIQKFSSEGEFLTKWGTYGSGNGQFNYPTGIAVDNSSGIVYVTDFSNNRVMKFSMEGAYIGSWGTFGDGNTEFKYPMDIDIDGDGIVYVMDANNRQVKKFDLNGNYIGKWGSYGSENGQFLSAWGIAVGSSDNVYVSDIGANRIQKFDKTGIYKSQWGSYGFAYLSAEFLATDSSGNIYVTDGFANKVWKFDSSGHLLLEWGGNGGGDGEFGGPRGIAVSASDIVYVVDSSNARIQMFDSEGGYIDEWGSEGQEAGQFDHPGAISIDPDGFVYVADMDNYRIQKFDSSGEYIAQWPINNFNEWDDFFRFNLDTDASGNVYVLHPSSNLIQKFNSSGNLLLQWGSYGSGDGQFSYPEGISVDDDGNVYVADSENNRIQQFDSNGNYVTQWGNGGSDDVELTYPVAITAGANGIFHVLEQKGNNIAEVRLFSPNNNANAASITLSEGTLSPLFAAAHTGPYTVMVPVGLGELTISPLPVDPLATMNVTVPSGTVTSFPSGNGTSFTVPLDEVKTPISVTITAVDGTTAKTYTIEAIRMSDTALLSDLGVDRGSLSPAFSSSELSYTVDVDNKVNRLNLSLIKAAPTQVITVSGAEYKSVADSVYTYTASLKVGENPIEITVTAEDETSNIYTLNVTRERAATGGGGGSIDVPAPTPSTGGIVTIPAGQPGEVSLGDEVVITIPANATDQELILTIEKWADTLGLLSKQQILSSSIFEIAKNFTENFKVPVTITFAFDPGKLGDGQRAGVFFYDETNRKWVEVPDAKVSGNRITVMVDHFTKFAVLATADEALIPEVTLNDIAGHWAKTNIELAVSKGIVKGYEDGTFKPNATVTRAEFTVMLMNALKQKEEGAALTFADAANIGNWAKQAIMQAVSLGVIKGYQDGSFRPNAEITRSEMASMIVNALGIATNATTVTGFADDKDIPLWAKGAAEALRERGLLQGKGNNVFAPNDAATRAEAVTILIQLLS